MSGVQDKTKKWDPSAPQSRARDELWLKIFSTTGLPLTFLENPYVQEYHQLVDKNYTLPGLYF
jgi:hypothetical protein